MRTWTLQKWQWNRTWNQDRSTTPFLGCMSVWGVVWVSYGSSGCSVLVITGVIKFLLQSSMHGTTSTMRHNANQSFSWCLPNLDNENPMSILPTHSFHSPHDLLQTVSTRLPILWSTLVEYLMSCYHIEFGAHQGERLITLLRSLTSGAPPGGPLTHTVYHNVTSIRFECKSGETTLVI